MRFASKQNEKLDLIESFSGIRGVYGKGITVDLAKKYAFACFKVLNRPKKIVIGGDTRVSTMLLKKAMIDVFSSCGAKEIIDIGVLPVQVLCLNILKFKAKAGIYITASHNEPEYNGWKFFRADGAILYPKEANRLIRLAKSQKKERALVKNQETKIVNKKNEAMESYVRLVVEKLGEDGLKKIKASNFKVLADPNGGSAAEILEKIFQKTGVKASVINKKPGEFKRLVEPNEKSLKYLNRQIEAGNFDFGAGFDCDADRVELVVSRQSDFGKEMGAVVSGNYTFALVAEAVFCGSKTKNSIVPVNDCTSFLVSDVLKKYGAKTKEVEVGEINAVKAMDKHKSPVGGEGSNGGVIFPPIKCRDGIMTVMIILKMLAGRKESLEEILKDYPKYWSEREKLRVLPDKSDGIKRKIEAFFKKKGHKTKRTGGFSGGLKILFGKKYFLWFRQSKTEAGAFRIISDGPDREKVKEILKLGVEVFNKFNAPLPKL